MVNDTRWSGLSWSVNCDLSRLPPKKLKVTSSVSNWQQDTWFTIYDQYGIYGHFTTKTNQAISFPSQPDMLTENHRQIPRWSSPLQSFDGTAYHDWESGGHLLCDIPLEGTETLWSMSVHYWLDPQDSTFLGPLALTFPVSLVESAHCMAVLVKWCRLFEVVITTSRPLPRDGGCPWIMLHTGICFGLIGRSLSYWPRHIRRWRSPHRSNYTIYGVVINVIFQLPLFQSRNLVVVLGFIGCDTRNCFESSPVQVDEPIPLIAPARWARKTQSFCQNTTANFLLMAKYWARSSVTYQHIMPWSVSEQSVSWIKLQHWRSSQDDKEGSSASQGLNDKEFACDFALLR